jgi:hypothetical protein
MEETKDKDKDKDNNDERKETKDVKEESKENQQDEKKKKVVSLQLGDIIKLFNSHDEKLNQKVFFINYIDNKGADLIHIDTFETVHIPIHENGIFGDGYMKKIELLKRNKYPGYARQHKLVPGTWVNIFFGGDIPTVVTAEITNLEEDMIELRLYPEEDIIYINFDYKGIPKDLRIETIEIREKPGSLQKKLGNPSENDDNATLSNKEQEVDLEVKEVVLNSEPEEEREKVVSTLKDLILQGNQIKFSHEYFGKATEMEDFSLEAQLNDMLHSILKDKDMEPFKHLNEIQVMLNRYAELRSEFSEFDSFGQVIDKELYSLTPKPLVHYFEDFYQNLPWIMPVVKNVKHMFDADCKSDGACDFVEVSLFANKLSDLLKQYESNHVDFCTMNRKMNELLTSFEELDAERSNEDVIATRKASTCLNTLVSNFEGFCSSVMQNNRIEVHPYVTQRYCCGENMEISSFVTLPLPFIRYSKISLPLTSILERCNLNKTTLLCWKLFLNEPIVNDVYITNLNASLNYSADNFGNNMKNYILNLQTDEAKSMSKSEVYKKFVKAMIPKTSVLFDIMKRYIQREFTLNEAIEVLEPFLVYSQNVTAVLLPEMQSFIKGQISLYKKRISSESRTFSLLKKLQSSKEVSVFSKSLLDILDRKNANKEDVLEAYDIDTELTSSSVDLYLKMFGSDYGRLFTDSVSLANIPLMFPKEMSDLLESESNKDKDKEGKQNSGDGEKKKENDDLSMCNGKKLVIAKSYKDEKQLLDDNDQELFFDKVFDKTNYAILDDYETEMQTMPAEDFIDFLPKALEEKYQLPKEEAEYLSDTLISGSKRVIDGQYAIISIKDTEDKNKSDIFYFKRVNNQWELDEDAVKMDVITTDDNLFCNLQEKCIAENKAIESNNTCESMKLNKVELQEDLLNEMLNEFDKKYFLSKEKFTKQLQSEYDEALARLPRLLYLKKHKWLKFNNQHYKLGFVYAEQQQGGNSEKQEKISFKDEDETKSDEPNELVYLSPYAKTLDAILSQTDFVKKQYDVATFANEFTREAFSSGLGPLGKKETIHWMYCIKTNVPLLPSFMATMATCFTNTPLQFTDCLWSIIRTNGVCKNQIWFDKYTGYPICDEFLSRSCDDKDKDEIKETKFYTKVQLLSSNEMKMIGKVVKQMEELMSLSLDHNRDFINFMISTMMTSKVPNEEEYLKRSQKSSNKPVPYHLFFQRNLVFFTLAAILVAIQTSVPGVRTRKTLPGCVRCFTGYPFDSTSMDMSSIQYLATLAYKQKQSEEPWSSLKKFDKEMLIKGIRSALDQGLLQLNEVRRKMEEKKLSVVKASREKQSISLQRWSGFLPPLIPIKLTHLINVTPEFKSSLLRDLKHGAANQRNKILVVESKIVQYSLAIQEKINEIVKKRVEASQVMSSCCEDINYMQDYSNTIKEYNDIVNNLNQILHDIRFSYVQSHLWSTHAASALNFPSLNHLTFDEKTMYLGLIQFCNLRNFCPIPDELLPICDSKPNNIRIGNTVDDIIMKLKDDKRDITQATFQRLLQLVGRNHMMKNLFTQDDIDDGNEDENGNREQKGKEKGKEKEKEREKEREKDEELFMKSLKGFETDMVDVFEKWFMERRNSERKKKNPDQKEESEILKFLKLKNDAMKTEIIHFLEVNKNCSLELKPLKEVLDNLKNNTKLKYYIHRFSQVLPKLIVEEVDNVKNEFPHTWNLNAFEEQKLADSVSMSLSSYRRFYNQNGMNIVLYDLIDSNKSLCELCNLVTMKNVDDVSEIEEDENKRETRFLLENILLKVFLQYIQWIKQEDHGCFTLSKKDNIKLNTENLREFNFKMSDLIVTFLHEIKDGNEINRRNHLVLIKKRENERRQKRRQLSLEKSEEDREMEDILSNILQN